MTRTAWRHPLRAWMRWKWRGLGSIPHPADRAVASVPGDPAIECVALGNGAISGWGVASHQLGLIGAVARALARRFGHGAVVRAAVDPAWTVAEMAGPAAELPWETAQVGILSYGPREVLISRGPRPWAHDLESLVRLIRSRMPEQSVLLVLGIPPVQALVFLRGIGRAPLDRLIARHNAAARALCDRLEGVRFVPMPQTGRGTFDQYRTAADYATWGEIVAGFVPLDAADVPLPPAAERERAAAVERLGLLDSPREERFDRIVRLARSVFRTRSAAFTVLHGDRQWYKSRVGFDVDEVPRRYSLCDIAVQAGAPLVVGDAVHDERFAEHPAVGEGGVRFYAGYPLRAPEGHFVGALCVFDAEPRDPADVDVAILRELALMVEAELEQSASG